MTRVRPREVGLKTVHLPVGAYASILHRITGVLFIAALALSLALLHISLEGPVQFRNVEDWMRRPLAHVLGPLVVWVVAQHLYGGIRHLTLDGGWGFGRERSRQTASAVIMLAVTTAFAAAILWP